MISKLPINEITSHQIFDTINEIEMTQNGIDKNNQKLKDDNYNLKYSMMLENISDKNIELKNPDFSSEMQPEKQFNDVNKLINLKKIFRPSI